MVRVIGSGARRSSGLSITLVVEQLIENHYRNDLSSESRFYLLVILFKCFHSTNRWVLNRWRNQSRRRKPRRRGKSLLRLLKGKRICSGVWNLEIQLGWKWSQSLANFKCKIETFIGLGNDSKVNSFTVEGSSSWRIEELEREPTKESSHDFKFGAN